MTADTEMPVLTAYIGGGQTLDIDMPLGSYRVRYATGRTWYGPSLLFGADTRYAQAGAPLDFYIRGDRVSGYTIEPIQRQSGNLETRYLPPGQFLKGAWRGADAPVTTRAAAR